MIKRRTIAILAVPGVQLLDVSGPLDVFAQANIELGDERYVLRVVGRNAAPIRSSSGVRLMPDCTLGEPLDRLDTLLVAGAPHAADIRLGEPMRQWLRTTARQARRFGSICSGAFFLAAAGLLDGRRVTTHWAVADALARAYPDIIVEADALHVRDGRLRTSAGVTAGLDLALSLVEEDCGRDVAARVASQLVMFFKRPGGQLQFSRKGHTGLAGRSALQEVQRWAAANPARNLSVEVLARRTGLSPRHFARLFRAEVGSTPAAWVDMMRVSAARERLETGTHTPKEVAALCGFANADTLRRRFVKQIGVSPAVYRRNQGGAGRSLATILVAIVATLGIAAASGCHDARDQRSPVNATRAAPSESPPVRPVTPAPALDRTGAKGETIYRVLGLLDEYLGRHVVDEGDDVVERFYCNESAIADAFGPLLERLAREQRIQTDVRRTTLQDCLPLFHSPELRAAIIALYPPPAPGPPQEWAQQPDGRMIPTHGRFVHADMFRDATAAQKWAYLSGVYQRNGHDNSIVLANASHKADLVAALLRELGVRDVARRTREGIPSANIVTFTPDADQRAKLGKSLAEPFPPPAQPR